MSGLKCGSVPAESAEKFEHTEPSVPTGLDRFQELRKHFPELELTLGGAYELWLGENASKLSKADGVYVGRFLDHGMKSESLAVQKVELRQGSQACMPASKLKAIDAFRLG